MPLRQAATLEQGPGLPERRTASPQPAGEQHSRATQLAGQQHADASASAPAHPVIQHVVYARLQCVPVCNGALFYWVNNALSCRRCCWCRTTAGATQAPVCSRWSGGRPVGITHHGLGGSHLRAGQRGNSAAALRSEIRSLITCSQRGWDLVACIQLTTQGSCSLGNGSALPARKKREPEAEVALAFWEAQARGRAGIRILTVE